MNDLNAIISEAFKSLKDVKDVPPMMPKKAKANEAKAHEAKSFDLSSKKDVDDAKKALAKSKKRDDREEKIVDVDANTVDKLKDSYLGNAILQCPVCRTLIYKKPDDLRKAEGVEGEPAQDGLYNVGDECPHCGSEDGFNLVGQVADMDVPEEEPETTTGAPGAQPADAETRPGEEASEEADAEVEGESGGFLRTKPVPTGESLDSVSSFDNSAFDALVEGFLSKTYSNVKSYKTVSGSVGMGKMVVEGVISFNSGKHEATKFEFFPDCRMPGGKSRMRGVNETFSGKRAFGLAGRVTEGAFVPDSLSYDFQSGETRVRGRCSGQSRKAKAPGD